MDVSLVSSSADPIEEEHGRKVNVIYIAKSEYFEIVLFIYAFLFQLVSKYIHSCINWFCKYVHKTSVLPSVYLKNNL